ncbi:MAG: NAD(P)-dependent oxidoreductase [Sumerlaeia bacterium]
MTPLRVHFLHGLSDHFLDFIRQRIDHPVRITRNRGDGEPTAEPDLSLPPDADFDILVVSGSLERRHLEASPNLRAVIVPWAGPPPKVCDLLRDFPHIGLHNLHHNAPATAEMAVALLMAAAKRMYPRERDFRARGWPEKQWHDITAIQLAGKSLLLLGYGAIGQRAATACHALGMRVRAVRRSVERETEIAPGLTLHPMGEWKSLLPLSNALMICLPGTPETRGLVGAEELRALAPPRLFVNVGRGEIADERAVYEALTDGTLEGAGIDVWWSYIDTSKESQPGAEANRPSRYPFHELDNVAMSPHRASLSREEKDNRYADLASLLNAAAAGDPIPNRVDLWRGY